MSRVDSQGRLKAGADLKKGYFSYMYDILYVTHFTLALSLISAKALWLLITIPGYAVWMLWSKFIKPWIFKSNVSVAP